MRAVSGRLMGGLGNQLFIMAAVFGYAKRMGISYGIYLRAVEHSPHTQNMYEWTVFKRIPKIEDAFALTYIYNEKGDRCLSYDKIGGERGVDTDHLLLFGYFQNEKYLEGGAEAQAFLNLLEFPNVEQQIDSWYANACFVHVRRGDYLQKHLHHVDLWTAYYPAAMEKMRGMHPDVNFLICSDDIDWCEGHPMFRDEEAPERFRFLHEKDEVKSMEIMSRCWIGAICANSSFSWWSAFKNKNTSKTVIFPSKWFNNDWPNDIAFRGSIVVQV